LNGVTTNLFTERTPAWVDVYGNPGFLKNGTAVWQSARNGWKHLYLYDNKGQLLRQLTSGKWEVRTFYGVDEARGWAYFSATKDSPIGENIYRVKLDGSAVERLTQGDGWHTASFNSTFTNFVDTWSDINTPPQYRLLRADGAFVRFINENKVPVLSEYKLGQTEFLKVKTRDGFEMEAMMVKPPDFDPNKRYPVLSYTYAGVHSPAVANRWNGTRNMWHQMMAQKGYIIWILDNRTASGKGQESAWPAYKNLGYLELRDLEDGVSYLKSLPYVDDGRIGIWGWSNGGFMTSYAMTHSKSFKAGIAGGTVSDWRLYDSIFTERVMMTPKNNPEGYEKSSVLKAAKNLSGRLLLIHGVMDNNVHMQNTTTLAYELQKANKQFDLMVYPTQRHGIVDPAQVRHQYQLMTDFFLKNL
jgi:dipeptidyl-peptidase-4